MSCECLHLPQPCRLVISLSSHSCVFCPSCLSPDFQLEYIFLTRNNRYNNWSDRTSKPQINCTQGRLKEPGAPPSAAVDSYENLRHKNMRCGWTGSPAWLGLPLSSRPRQVVTGDSVE